VLQKNHKNKAAYAKNMG